MTDFENFRKEKITINLLWANIFALLLLIPVLVTIGIPYYFIWKRDLNVLQLLDQLTPLGAGLRLLLILIIMISGIVMHELIHGFTWSFFTLKGFRSMKFGVLWEMLTPYCHCEEPLKKKHYVSGAITPGIILGLLPCVLALITGSMAMLIFGIFFTISAAGDILIIWSIRKEKWDVYVLDHPSEAGCYVLRKKE